MKTCLKLTICFSLLLVAARPSFSAENTANFAPDAGPLHTYVKKADDSYRWEKRQVGTLGKATWAELILTSQHWKDTTWRHQLYVIKPSEVKSEAQGILLIDGGAWKDELAQAPAGDKPAKLPQEVTLLAQVAERVKSPVAVLKQVPNQPIFDGLTEDGAISYTFEQFLNTRDATWPLLLPMVKSAVRGMDAVQEFAKKEWSLDIKNFTLTGASKRGWTTWLTASVDPRVNAFAPMVIDTLNMSAQMKLQIESFGEFSEQIQDYTKRGIQQQGATEAGQMLEKIVDPFSYRSLLKQPKVILLGTNDPYWPLEALNLYWGELNGQKHILYVPNNGHGLNDFTRIIGTISALHRQAAGGKPLAKLSWELDNDKGNVILTVKADTRPSKVSAWTAAAETRDFRQSKWTSHPAEQVGDAYRYELPAPKSGFAAIFGEAVFDSDSQPYFLSTNVKVVKARDGDDVAR